MVAVPVAVGPSLVVAPVRTSPVVVGRRADPVARVDANPSQVVLADSPDIDVAPIDRVAATDDRPVVDARAVADAADPAGAVIDARAVADAADPAGAVVDAGPVADAADPAGAVVDAGRLPMPPTPPGRLSMPGRLPMPPTPPGRLSMPGRLPMPPTPPGRLSMPGGCRRRRAGCPGPIRGLPGDRRLADGWAGLRDDLRRVAGLQDGRRRDDHLQVTDEGMASGRLRRGCG